MFPSSTIAFSSSDSLLIRRSLAIEALHSPYSSAAPFRLSTFSQVSSGDLSLFSTPFLQVSTGYLIPSSTESSFSIALTALESFSLLYIISTANACSDIRSSLNPRCIAFDSTRYTEANSSGRFSFIIVGTFFFPAILAAFTLLCPHSISYLSLSGMVRTIIGTMIPYS